MSHRHGLVGADRLGAGAARCAPTATTSSGWSAASRAAPDEARWDPADGASTRRRSTAWTRSCTSRRRRRRPAVDEGVQAQDPRQPRRGHPHDREALAAADRRPGVLVSGSAIGYYGDTGDREIDEDAPAGEGFLADLVRDWEAAAQPAADGGRPGRPPPHRCRPQPREGGVLGRTLPLFRLGLGAPLGLRTAVDELDLHPRPDRGAALPHRARDRRAGQPHRAEPGHQRRRTPGRWAASCAARRRSPCPPSSCGRRCATSPTRDR